MVRLKVPEVVIEIRDAVIFQFHYGSIKGLQGYGERKAEFYFNSTMVRLKA